MKVSLKKVATTFISSSKARPPLTDRSNNFTTKFSKNKANDQQTYVIS